MLTAEENDRITRAGPGTPGGELLRRYWRVDHGALRANAAEIDDDKADGDPRPVGYLLEVPVMNVPVRVRPRREGPETRCPGLGSLQ